MKDDKQLPVDLPPEEDEGQSRREFLMTIKGWSAAVVIGATVAGLAPEAEAGRAAWGNRGGGGGAAWGNRGGGSGAAWGNRSGGGGAAWGNRSGGGGGAWVNHRGGGGVWANGGRCRAWANGGSIWANHGSAWANWR
jgi:hypothetical protein